jgi:hypothetical protein
MTTKSKPGSAPSKRQRTESAVTISTTSEHQVHHRVLENEFLLTELLRTTSHYVEHLVAQRTRVCKTWYRVLHTKTSLMHIVDLRPFRQLPRVPRPIIDAVTHAHATLRELHLRRVDMFDLVNQVYKLPFPKLESLSVLHCNPRYHATSFKRTTHWIDELVRDPTFKTDRLKCINLNGSAFMYEEREDAYPEAWKDSRIFNAGGARIPWLCSNSSASDCQTVHDGELVLRLCEGVGCGRQCLCQGNFDDDHDHFPESGFHDDAKHKCTTDSPIGCLCKIPMATECDACSAVFCPDCFQKLKKRDCGCNGWVAHCSNCSILCCDCFLPKKT